MRLDHLLSKETSADASVCCNILRSGSEAELMIFSLFNLEGIPQEVKIGCGGLAQLGERLPCKQEVSGSIPLISTKYLRRSEPRKYGPIAQLARAHD